MNWDTSPLFQRLCGAPTSYPGTSAARSTCCFAFLVFPLRSLASSCAALESHVGSLWWAGGARCASKPAACPTNAGPQSAAHGNHACTEPCGTNRASECFHSSGLSFLPSSFSNQVHLSPTNQGQGKWEGRQVAMERQGQRSRGSGGQLDRAKRAEERG